MRDTEIETRVDCQPRQMSAPLRHARGKPVQLARLIAVAGMIACGIPEASSGSSSREDSSQKGDGGPASDDAAEHDTTVEPVEAVGQRSIEFGRTAWGSDHAVRSDAPQGGTLFTVWTRIPDPGSTYPWVRGNMDAYVLYGDNWHMRCLVGNSSANSPSDAGYNANVMLFVDPDQIWVHDYAYFGEVGIDEAPLRGWVWVAWQVLVREDSFTIRQWLKFGLEGELIKRESEATPFADVRAQLVEAGWSEEEAAAWTPSDAVAFQVGKDNGYLTHARMYARDDEPSPKELEAIALQSSADPEAWADYPLVFVDGKPDLRDHSGHERDLRLEDDGRLYRGPSAPMRYEYDGAE